MYMNVIDLSKSVSFVLEDIDIGGQIQYLTCTGPLYPMHPVNHHQNNSMPKSVSRNVRWN